MGYCAPKRMVVEVPIERPLPVFISEDPLREARGGRREAGRGRGREGCSLGWAVAWAGARGTKSGRLQNPYMIAIFDSSITQRCATTLKAAADLVHMLGQNRNEKRTTHHYVGRPYRLGHDVQGGSIFRPRRLLYNLAL